MSNTNVSNGNVVSINTNFANLSESECKKITDLELTILEETGEKVALVAYHID